jgi:hypothetical protein
MHQAMRIKQRRTICVAVLKVLAYTFVNNLCDDCKYISFYFAYKYSCVNILTLLTAHYRAQILWKNENEIDEEFYGFISMEYFFNEILPTVLAKWKEDPNIKLIFDYKKEEIMDALENYEDAYGKICR